MGWWRSDRGRGRVVEDGEGWGGGGVTGEGEGVGWWQSDRGGGRGGVVAE